MNPSIDIVIAGRNEERHLSQCLKALRGQDYPAELLRIFYIDNGSTDNSSAIAREMGVELLVQPKPGAAAARNLGIDAGKGELVGFLDAHCIPNSSWAAAMAAPFRDESVGGCQARIESRSDDLRVQRYLDETGVSSNERVLEDTLWGKKNLYPWLLAGNSMIRRRALREAGNFNEDLHACEDVELSWRIVLLGYELRYVDEAQSVHYDGNSWSRFLKKGFTYARGSADLARMFRGHGASSKFAPAPLWTGNAARSRAGLWYRAGYALQNWRFALGWDRSSSRAPVAMQARFRPRFFWADNEWMQISSDAIYWFRPDLFESVIVHIPTRQRLVLGSVGDFIWKRLAAQSDREALMQAMVEFYGVAPVTALADATEFVEELIESGVLLRSIGEENEP